MAGGKTPQHRNIFKKVDEKATEKRNENCDNSDSFVGIMVYFICWAGIVYVVRRQLSSLRFNLYRNSFFLFLIAPSAGTRQLILLRYSHYCTRIILRCYHSSLFSSFLHRILLFRAYLVHFLWQALIRSLKPSGNFLHSLIGVAPAPLHSTPSFSQPLIKHSQHPFPAQSPVRRSFETLGPNKDAWFS